MCPFPRWVVGRPEDGEGMEQSERACVSVFFTLLMADVGQVKKQADSGFRTYKHLGLGILEGSGAGWG